MIDLKPTRTLKRKSKINYLIEIHTNEIDPSESDHKFSIELFGKNKTQTRPNHKSAKIINQMVTKMKFLDYEIEEIIKMRLCLISETRWWSIKQILVRKVEG